jgi:hypothetical protein
MYTLRLFKDVKEIDRTQIYLGDSYQVVGASEEDKKLNVKYRVFGNWDKITKDGICIYYNDNAFIMTALGMTFETLNRASDFVVKD